MHKHTHTKTVFHIFIPVFGYEDKRFWYLFSCLKAIPFLFCICSNLCLYILIQELPEVNKILISMHMTPNSSMKWRVIIGEDISFGSQPDLHHHYMITVTYTITVTSMTLCNTLQ